MKYYSLIKLIIIGMGLLSLVTSALASTYEIKEALTRTISPETHPTDTPPEWAIGSFNGTFGILKHGIPSLELGRIEGYWESNVIGYSRFEKGHLQGEFFENESLIPNWNFSTKMFSRFQPTHSISIIYGRLSNIQEKSTYFLIGIGKLTIDGTLEFKIFTILNDNYYLKGNYILFEE